MRAKLTGLHKATKRLADGSRCVYAYAYKGGPLIAKGSGRTLTDANRDLEKRLGTADALAALEDARTPVRTSQNKAFVTGMVTAFYGSPEFARLGASSQREYRRYLDSFRAEFGDWKVRLFENAETREDLLDWRDEWAERGSRAADYALQSVGRLFKWGRSRGLTNARPTEDVERLHKADHSDDIWTAVDLAKLMPHALPGLQRAVRLAAETGLRLGDLVALPWSDVKEHAIVTRTSKSQRKRQVVIPLTDEARRILADCPRVGPVVLTNARGRPWTADGLKSVFRKARAKAGIKGLRFHDLRGTFATRLPDLSDREMADLLGWSEGAVRDLRRRYVSSSEVALDLLARIEQKRRLANRPQTG